MATLTPVRISGPGTHRLADMHGVQQDLSWVIDVCGRILRNHAGPSRHDTLEMEALEGAALIRYGRCYKGGARTAFLLDGSWISKLPPELQQAHRDLEALRDKHVAHSVNDWELNVPVAYLRQEEGKSQVDSISVQSYRIVGLAPETIAQLKTLAQSLKALIAEESKIEASRVLAIAKQIPIADLETRMTEPAIDTGVKRLDTHRGR
jgi:hypothetical protein